MESYAEGDAYAAFLYDAVWLYAIALNESVEVGLNTRSGTDVASRMRGKVFTGTCKMSRHPCAFILQMTDYEKGDRYAAFLYDAVYLYAVAINETLTRGLDPRKGSNIAEYMRRKIFHGIVTTADTRSVESSSYDQLYTKDTESGGLDHSIATNYI